jgi:hypothetical protein
VYSIPALLFLLVFFVRSFFPAARIKESVLRNLKVASVYVREGWMFFFSFFARLFVFNRRTDEGECLTQPKGHVGKECTSFSFCFVFFLACVYFALFAIEYRLRHSQTHVHIRTRTHTRFQVRSSAAKSCKQIVDNGTSDGDGYYWVKPHLCK